MRPLWSRSTFSGLLENAAAFARRHKMIAPGQRIGVAVSGGADSVVLLHVLHRLRSEFACELTVLHVNHRLRAAESEEDEAFVRSLAGELGLSCVVESAGDVSGNLEQSARDARRAFFKRAMREHGFERVALGHTRGDQAETVLFRLLRGAGLTGLAGMRPVTSDGLIRPLLACARQEIRAWAKQEGIRWRDDSSNLNTAFTRNRLRLETLPALENAYNPNLESLLAQSADLAQTEEDYWDDQVEDVYVRLAQRSAFGLEIAVGDLATLHLALRRRLVRRLIREVRGDLRGIEYEHVESIVRLCKTDAAHDRVIVPGVDALRSFARLLLSRPGERAAEARDYRLDLELEGEYELPFRSGFLSVNRLKTGNRGHICVNFKTGKEDRVEICDWDSARLGQAGTLPSLWVRNWQPGDSFQPMGRQSSEKVKTLFQENKVLLWQRKHWPVVLARERIVWVRRFGAAASVGAAAETGDVIRLTYRPG